MPRWTNSSPFWNLGQDSIIGSLLLLLCIYPNSSFNHITFVEFNATGRFLHMHV